MTFSLKSKTIAGVILGIIAIISLITYDNRGTEIDKTVRAVSKHILLPNEKPSLATVKDPSQVKEAFLKQAKTGDKVLVYSDAGKIIIYRPSLNRIVAVGNVTIDTALIEAKGARIVIRNGSNIAGAADTAAARLKQIYPNIGFIKIENASRATFENTIGIDLSPDQKYLEFATGSAQVFGGQAGIVPLGEQKPANADVLIIIGNNFKS
jgi:hypothetical protein